MRSRFGLSAEDAIQDKFEDIQVKRVPYRMQSHCFTEYVNDMLKTGMKAQLADDSQASDPEGDGPTVQKTEELLQGDMFENDGNNSDKPPGNEQEIVEKKEGYPDDSS